MSIGKVLNQEMLLLGGVPLLGITQYTLHHEFFLPLWFSETLPLKCKGVTFQGHQMI